MCMQCNVYWDRKWSWWTKFKFLSCLLWLLCTNALGKSKSPSLPSWLLNSRGDWVLVGASSPKGLFWIQNYRSGNNAATFPKMSCQFTDKEKQSVKRHDQLHLEKYKKKKRNERNYICACVYCSSHLQ